jgi:hypothetical protein
MSWPGKMASGMWYLSTQLSTIRGRRSASRDPAIRVRSSRAYRANNPPVRNWTLLHRNRRDRTRPDRMGPDRMGAGRLTAPEPLSAAPATPVPSR